MKVELDLDEVVGLVLEFAEFHHIHVKTVKKMNDAYDVGNPSEQEKLQFLRGILPLLPANSYLVDIVKGYLAAVDAGEVEYANAKVEQVFDHLLEDGGLVTVYRVKSIMLDDFYVATFDDGDDEVTWGIGDNVTDALESAQREWNHFNPDDTPDENPFTLTLESIQS